MNQKPAVSLSCEQCQQRKTKCDKRAPCSACQRAGLTCHVVQRARFPRGRSSKVQRRSNQLENRVGRIETLVQQIQSQISSEGSGRYVRETTRKTSDGLSDTMESRHGLSEFVASDFWTALSQEIAGLRETIEDSENEDTNSSTTVDLTANQGVATAGPETLLFNENLGFQHDYTPPQPNAQLEITLLDSYRYRVDSVYKVLHWPTTLAKIRQTRTMSHPSVQALEMAIYFMAVCSMTENECVENAMGNKIDLLRRYRTATETFMSQANLLSKPDLFVLQAFLIYLLGIRTCMNCATAWTLIATAVRVATALGLDSGDSKDFSAFDIQIRRRVWFCLGVMDTQAALDRGTAPLIPRASFGALPLDINDSDMSYNSVPEIPSSGFTDMSFSILAFESMLCHKGLCDSPRPGSTGLDDWVRKSHLVESYAQAMQAKYFHISLSAEPLRKLTRLAAEDIVMNMRLLLWRPLYRQQQQFIPPTDHFDIMEMATEVLERNLRFRSSDLSPWVWKSWIKWYALAVSLSELCTRTAEPLASRAYSVAQQAFDNYASRIADSDSGMLWKPIKNLMRKVQHLRETRNGRRGSCSTMVNGVTEANSRITSVGQVDVEGAIIALQPSCQNEYTFSDQTLGTMDYRFNSNNGGQATTDQYGNSTFAMSDVHLETNLSWINWDLFLEDIQHPTDHYGQDD